MDLFLPQVKPSKQHFMFKMMLEERFAPERQVLNAWAEGFLDRDGKFVREFQTTFESGLWELYLNAVLNKCWGLNPDMSVPTPDFVIKNPSPLCIEATIAMPPNGKRGPIGWKIHDIPEDFNKFNSDASIRICNSFSYKVRRYRENYSKLSYVKGRPYVIAIAAFDCPLSHFAAERPLFSAIYGLYYDESRTPIGSKKVTSYNVFSAKKSEKIEVPLGLFCDRSYSDVSAVIYSSLVTWGKVRALAVNPSEKTIYTTYHPNKYSIQEKVFHTLKYDYSEHLLDGTFICHNPFANYPIKKGILSHPRVAEVRVAPDGELLIEAPDDFLLIITLLSFR